MTIDEAFDILHSLPPEWGASESEVCAVEDMLGVRLPATLRELMLYTGRREHMGWLFPDRGIGSLDELLELQQCAAEIVAGDPPHLRPNYPFVALSQHQGYYFSFVRADNSESEPEVLGYNERHGISPPGGVTLRQAIALAVMWATRHD